MLSKALVSAGTDAAELITERRNNSKIYFVA